MLVPIHNARHSTRLSEVDERVGIVRHAELLALVLHVVLDHEVWTQRRFVALPNPTSAEALVPLRTAAVRDRAQFPAKQVSRT